MITIRALRQFSHYHAGTFDQKEERRVDPGIAEALVGMELAEYVDAPQAAEPKAGKKK